MLLSVLDILLFLASSVLDMDMMCLASKPFSSNSVIVVALRQWLVYILDSSSSCDKVFIFAPSVFCPTGILSYQTVWFSDTPSLGLCQKHSFSGFKTARYFWSVAIGQSLWPGTAYNHLPDSSSLVSPRWFFVKWSLSCTYRSLFLPKKLKVLLL